jgi:uncharacterized repeat protein (TIGR03803 family)
MGTVFRLTSAGVLTYLASFDGTNGYMPWGGLVWGDDGSLYGVARNSVTPEHSAGYGTVFKCTTNGNLSLVATFYRTNGAHPTGPLAKAGDGSFYGTTYWGGEGSDAGTVFRVTTNGTLSVLATFGGTMGYYLHEGLAKANDGCFYGTSEVGGLNGVGVLFKVCDGAVSTVLHFGGPVGAFPVGPLTIGIDGNLYGTTARGTNYDYSTSTAFRFTTNGVFTTLFIFDAVTGTEPMGGIAQAADGSLFGSFAVKPGLFRITATGVLTRLCSFEGIHAMAQMIVASDGNVYGCLSDYQMPYGDRPGMIFRLVEPPRITFLTTNQTTALTWNSFTNGVYQVEYKPSIEATQWTPRLPSITATGSVTTFVDAPGTTSGFYRVVLLP